MSTTDKAEVETRLIDGRWAVLLPAVGAVNAAGPDGSEAGPCATTYRR